MTVLDGAVETEKGTVQSERGSGVITQTDFQHILDNIQDIVVVLDTNLNVIYVNRTAERVTGYGAEEFSEQLFNCIHADDRDELIRLVEDAYERDEQGQVECRILSKSGGDKWMLARYQPFHDKTEDQERFLLTFVEITRRKQMEDEIRESEEKFLAISDSAQDAVIVANSSGKISFWNPAATRMFGYTLADIEGKDLHQLLVPERYREAAKKGLAAFSESGTGNVVGKTVELKALKRDGTQFPVGLSLSSVRLKGEWHAVAMVRDITEQQKSREQLMQSDRLAAIGTLAAGVAHEINNPIGYINSNLNTMKKYLGRINDRFENPESLNEDAKQNMDDILTDFGDAIDESVEGTNRVKQIVADLKSFSRVDRAQKESADLNEGIRSTLNIVWNELKYKAKVETELGDLPDLFCMPNQLNQVFMNILVNAGHAIEGNDGQITIKSWADERNIYVSIEDNGSGMPDSVQKRIFEPFFTTKDVGKGTGLGLSLVHDIVKKHGGKIEVKSQIGVGTDFVVILPLKGIDAEENSDTNGR